MYDAIEILDRRDRAPIGPSTAVQPRPRARLVVAMSCSILGLCSMLGATACTASEPTHETGPETETGTGTGTETGVEPSGGTETESDGRAAELELNDVAILFPLPTSAETDGLLRAGSDGGRGVLLPAYAMDPVENLTLGATGAGAPSTNAELVPLLRVVAVNIDPCFPDGTIALTEPEKCRRQIRHVWQPVVADADGTMTTLDITLHTFHDLTEEEFRTLVGELLELKGSISDPDAPLGIHPQLQREGPGGSYAEALQAILLRYSGQSNLTKLTFSSLKPSGLGWRLGGFDFEGDVATAMLIAATDFEGEEQSKTQEFVNGTTDVADFAASVQPRTEFSTALAVLLDSATARSASDEAIQAAVRRSLEIDDPETTNNPDTVDCVSCHVATPVRLWAERNRSIAPETLDAAYESSRWNLELRTEVAADTRSTRCFGYFEDHVAISQRTVNEAAAVTDFINQHIVPEIP